MPELESALISVSLELTLNEISLHDPVLAMQVTKYTVREILNHKRLVHPHIVEMKEVSMRDSLCAGRWLSVETRHERDETCRRCF